MKWGVMGTDGDRSLNKPSVVMSRPLAAAVDINVNITTCVNSRVVLPDFKLFSLELLSSEEIVLMKTVDSTLCRLFRVMDSLQKEKCVGAI